MRLLRIFIGVLIIILFTGCLDTLLDDISPSIFFDNVQTVNGEYVKVYSGQNVTIQGRVEDNDEIDYVKNDEQKIELKDGEFQVVIPNTKTETIFQVKDKAGNKTTVKVKLSEDVILPLFSEITINDETYVENMVIGEITNLNIAIKITDINGIERVEIAGDTITSGEGEYFLYNYKGIILDGDNTIAVDVWDNAGNWNMKNINFYYDREAPVLESIKMDDDELDILGTIIYTGKAAFKMELNFNDKSENINVISMSLGGNSIAGTISGKKIIIDPIVLNEDSVLEFTIEDEFTNRITQNINIRYRNQVPLIENVEIKLSDDTDIVNESGVYYTKESVIVINGTVDGSTGSGLYLKSFSVNDDIHVLSNLGEFSKTVALNLVEGENLLELVAINNANTKTVQSYRIYYDANSPIVSFDNLLKDTEELNSYINFRKSGIREISIQGTVDEGKLKSFQIGEEDVVLDEDGKFEIRRSVVSLDELVYRAEDQSGNITIGSIKAITDDQSPGYRAGTIKINGEEYYENIIVEAKGEDLTIDIEIEAIDNNGVNKVSLDLKTFDKKDLITDIFIMEESNVSPGINVKDLRIEDFAGNVNSNTTLRYRYYNGEPDINGVKLAEKEIVELEMYYVSESSVALEFNAVSGDSEMAIERLTVKVNGTIAYEESGDDGIKNIENLYLNLKDEINIVEIYLKNESGKEISKTYNLYYDAKTPIVSDIKVAYTSFGKKLSEIDYIQNMAYPYPEESRQANTVLLTFNLEDDKGLDEDSLKIVIEDSEEIERFEKNGTEYTFEIDRDNIVEGLNRIEILVFDISGNLLNSSIYINFYKLYAIELDEPRESEVNTDSLKVRWKDIANKDELLDRYELYMRLDGDINYTLVTETRSNYANVFGLKDNERYEFYVKVYDQNYDSPNNTIDSIHKLIRTENRKPDVTVIKLENVNKEISGLRDYGIRISWAKVAVKDEHDFSSYLIYRNDKESENESDYKLIAQIDEANQLVYSDESEDLKENKLIKYRIAIQDKGGEISNYSNEIEMYSYNLKPDVENSSFKFSFNDGSGGRFGVNDGFNKIKLSLKFQDVKDEIKDLDRYEVYRSRDYDIINNEEVKPNQLIYTGYISGTRLQSSYKADEVEADLVDGYIVVSEIGLKENRKYYYLIRVYDSDRDLYDKATSVLIGDINEYSETEIHEVITKDLSPPKPTVRAETTDNSVSLYWEMDYIDDFDSYKVYRLDRSINRPQLIIEDISESRYNDVDIDFIKYSSYPYQIEVYDEEGNITKVRFEVDRDGNISEY